MSRSVPEKRLRQGESRDVARDKECCVCGTPSVCISSILNAQAPPYFEAPWIPVVTHILSSYPIPNGAALWRI